MTRTISLITATVGAALLFAVPAWGDNWGADKQPADRPADSPPDGVDDSSTSSSAAELAWRRARRSRAVRSSSGHDAGARLDARSDGLNRLYGLGEYANPIDARERALVVPKTSQPQLQGFEPGATASTACTGSASTPLPSSLTSIASASIRRTLR